MYNFDQVSLLITHYKRSQSLERLLEAIHRLSIVFGEIVVSDDGSPAEHLNYIEDVLQKKFDFKLIKAAKNSGLGSNINKGQDAVTKPYTLYIQEDFVPTKKFPEMFSEALQLMEENAQWDLVRLWAFFQYPYIKPFKGNFSEMIFKEDVLHTNHRKFYLYSDNPHLRRSDFLKKFGRYMETLALHGDRVEFLMALSVLNKNGRGLIYNNITELFDHMNTNEEPSLMGGERWTRKYNFIKKIIREIYLKYKLLKWTGDFSKFKKHTLKELRENVLKEDENILIP